MMETLKGLLMAWNTVRAEIEDALRRQHGIRMAIISYMDWEKAEERSANGQTVTLKAVTEWHKPALTPLLEIMSEEELKSSGAYIPEQTKVIPPDWDMRKVKPLARYSAEARRIIESAERKGLPELKITEKRC
jgi:hypothetical protein